MNSISSVIIAKNEERNIARCIESVRDLGEVIVADTGSTDNTPKIAERLGAKVYQIQWRGFGASKREACNLAESDYILSIDADEVVSDHLAEEINAVVASDGALSGYYFPRITNFCGHWIHHSGWYPEYVLRLFRRDSAHFTNDMIHESIECHGKTTRLTGRFLHYSYPDMKSFAVKLREYTILGARKYRDKGGRLAMIRMVVNPPIWFLKKFIFQFGFADGIAGLWIAALSAVGQFLKYHYALTGSER